MDLPFPSPRALLAQHGLRPKKSFGQNFLGDAALVDKIAAEAGPAAQVLEIGAGLGALTYALLARDHRVTAVERDRDLLPVLRSHFQPALDDGRLRLLEADAKAIDFVESLPEPGLDRVLAGNLPYQLTGPLLQKTVAVADQITRAVFLVQLEVAERLTAQVGTSAYGGMTVFMSASYSVRRAFTVRRGAFFPAPNVDSAVITLTPKTERIAETPTFRELVRAAFGQRRKTLRNTWKHLYPADAEALRRAASRAEVDLDARGETLSAADFHRMSLAVGEDAE